jgi:hypothetical protein
MIEPEPLRRIPPTPAAADSATAFLMKLLLSDDSIVDSGQITVMASGKGYALEYIATSRLSK